MRTNGTKNLNEQSESSSSPREDLHVQTLESAQGVSPVAHKSYHEMADRPLVEVDSLSQLHSNLDQLSDLQARLAFVMREVRYLVKG
jgi:hypothetical protein